MTLGRIRALEPTSIIPGHGDVLSGDYAIAYLDQVVELLDVVTSLTQKHLWLIGSSARTMDKVLEAVGKGR